MKFLITWALFILSSLSSIAQWKSGDIIFQETPGQQADVIKLATRSSWTHVGVVLIHDGKVQVLEAVQPVRFTSLAAFLKRSVNGNYQVMRLKDASALDNIPAEKTSQWIKKQLNKPYDKQFRWSDNKLYCSELVWKIYRDLVGIELCQPRKLGNYHLDHPHIKTLIKHRYGSLAKLPRDESVVAPSDIAQSALLEIVQR